MHPNHNRTPHAPFSLLLSPQAARVLVALLLVSVCVRKIYKNCSRGVVVIGDRAGPERRHFVVHTTNYGNTRALRAYYVFVMLHLWYHPSAKHAAHRTASPLPRAFGPLANFSNFSRHRQNSSSRKCSSSTAHDLHTSTPSSSSSFHLSNSFCYSIVSFMPIICSCCSVCIVVF